MKILFLLIFLFVMNGFAIPSENKMESRQKISRKISEQHSGEESPNPKVSEKSREISKHQGSSSQKTETLESILSGDEKITPISADTLRNKFRRDFNSLKHWWQKEADALWWLFAGTAFTSLSVIIALFMIHRMKRKIKLTNSLPLRHELFFAFSEPLLIFIGLIGIFLFFLPVLQSLPEFYTFNVRIFFTLFTLSVAWGGMEFITVISRRMYQYARREDNNLDALMVEITRKLLKIILTIITLLFIGQNIFGWNITTLLAGAGVVGLAIAFASKETLSNFFGTLVIILDKPFRCGDRIQINGIDGIVDSVGMRSTRIRTYHESIFTIPNSQMESSSIENISSEGRIRFAFTVGLVYECSPEQIQKAMNVLHEITDHFHGEDPEQYKPRIFLDVLADSSINLKVIMWFKTSSFSDEESWRTEINLAIVKRFGEENLSMAYNTVTNYLCGDAQHPLHVLTDTSKTN